MFYHTKCLLLSRQDTPMNPILDSLSDDVIIIEEQLTCKWNVHVSGSSTLPEFSYEVVSRAIDAWVLEYDETHTFLQLESRPKRTLTERKIDIPPLLLQNRHLSKLIATVEDREPVSESSLLYPGSYIPSINCFRYLAKLLGKKLISLNLSNQSEASDLLGGFKPLDSAEDRKCKIH
ncbi:uncharacterized protein VP01_1044g1 [Puccinia sorghi]|uniref:Uncharacterized protein n=1 Tax=Puccinia sorghi TaxID=27349 RepID=A0A0L6VVN9_9BASI|nr:uncharacterized protein VP01_1044g1 [Puccinia sorghi]